MPRYEPARIFPLTSKKRNAPAGIKEETVMKNRKNFGSASARCEFSVDNSFRIITWDADMERLCHKPAQTVIGRGINKIFPMLYEKVALVFVDGKKKQMKKFRNFCFFGSDFSADIMLKPLKNREGRVQGVSVVLSGISGGCPYDKTLSDSQQMIAIGKIASTLAHGTRNPLNAIKGAVVYLTGKYGNEPTLAEFGKIINDEIDRLDNFISNFLSSARGDSQSSTADLNNIIRTILVMIKPRAESQKIRVSSNFTHLPHVVIDPFQTEQAFFNIINNALEAMPEGGRLSIRTSVSVEDGIKYAVVEISDSGKGLSRKALSRLGQLSSKNDREGRGFGIFLTREIIKASGGKLFCESEREKGTHFKILLPLRTDE
ncbi:MAG: GHKL domain-containing protein [Nitrospirae bacterium]|nr:GHKL domain-containing protein [Nitrospirota bacterium]